MALCGERSSLAYVFSFLVKIVAIGHNQITIGRSSGSPSAAFFLTNFYYQISHLLQFSDFPAALWTKSMLQFQRRYGGSFLITISVGIILSIFMLIVYIYVVYFLIFKFFLLNPLFSGIS